MDLIHCLVCCDCTLRGTLDSLPQMIENFSLSPGMKTKRLEHGPSILLPSRYCAYLYLAHMYASEIIISNKT